MTTGSKALLVISVAVCAAICGIAQQPATTDTPLPGGGMTATIGVTACIPAYLQSRVVEGTVVVTDSPLTSLFGLVTEVLCLDGQPSPPSHRLVVEVAANTPWRLYVRSNWTALLPTQVTLQPEGEGQPAIALCNGGVTDITPATHFAGEQRIVYHVQARGLLNILPSVVTLQPEVQPAPAP